MQQLSFPILKFAIDEIDFYDIEEEPEGIYEREPRLATGIQSGIKILDFMKIKGCQILMEYVKTSRWMYNYRQEQSNPKDDFPPQR